MGPEECDHINSSRCHSAHRRDHRSLALQRGVIGSNLLSTDFSSVEDSFIHGFNYPSF